MPSQTILPRWRGFNLLNFYTPRKGSDIYYSGHSEINELFKLYGGGIKIPIFEE